MAKSFQRPQAAQATEGGFERTSRSAFESGSRAWKSDSNFFWQRRIQFDDPGKHKILPRVCLIALQAHLGRIRMLTDDDFPDIPVPAYREVVSPISEEVPSSFEHTSYHRPVYPGGTRFAINGHGGGDGDHDQSESPGDTMRSPDTTAWMSGRVYTLSANNSSGSLDEMAEGKTAGNQLKLHDSPEKRNSMQAPFRPVHQQRQPMMTSQNRFHVPPARQGSGIFDPSAPAFNPNVQVFRPLKQGPAVGPSYPGAGKSRLPVFSQLQSMDSGSEKGSSRRSDRSSPTNSIDSLTNSVDSMHTDGSVAPRLLIRELTQKMGSKDEAKAAAAAKKVFDIVRESCPTWRQNQTEICRSPEMLATLAGLLRAGSERCRCENISCRFSIFFMWGCDIHVECPQIRSMQSFGEHSVPKSGSSWPSTPCRCHGCEWRGRFVHDALREILFSHVPSPGATHA